jgi:hypothetical protein
MPCDQVRTTTTEWSEATDFKLVADAMRALGYKAVVQDARHVVGEIEDKRVSLVGGSLIVRDQYGDAEFDAGPLKQRYAAEVLKDRFATLGWTVAEQGKAQATIGLTREW